MNEIMNAFKKEPWSFISSIMMIVIIAIMLQFTIGVWIIWLGTILGTGYFTIIMIHRIFRPVHFMVEMIVNNARVNTSMEFFWISMWGCTGTGLITIFLGHFWLGVLNLINILAMGLLLKPIEVKE